MIGRVSCPVCADTILTYSKVAQESGVKEVYYFSLEDIYQQYTKDSMFNEENNEILDYLENYLKFDGATPVFYYIKDGQLKHSSNEIIGINKMSWEDKLRKLFESN